MKNTPLLYSLLVCASSHFTL